MPYIIFVLSMYHVYEYITLTFFSLNIDVTVSSKNIDHPLIVINTIEFVISTITQTLDLTSANVYKIIRLREIMALKGLKVIEMMGLAPGPYCGSVLADFGANVTVVQKINALSNAIDVMSNNKRVININLKSDEGVEIFKKMCLSSDILLDTFRPGVMEKMGLGPNLLLRDNPRLIYARLSGYGQTGYFKDKAGHDINYIAMAGILSLLSKNKQPPSVPLNLIADFAGGSLFCVIGILLALIERSTSGKGQVIDCSMTEGAAYLGTWLFKSRKLPIWLGEPGSNMLDGGAPFYSCYKTKDGKFMAVGALEPQFYSKLLEGLRLSESDYIQGFDIECKKKFEEVFLSKTQEEWCNIFDKLDACVTPVLDIENVDKHLCNISRNSFYRDNENLVVPEVSPKLSKTPGVSSGKNPLPKPGEHTIQVLLELGYSNHEIEELISRGFVYANMKSRL